MKYFILIILVLVLSGCEKKECGPDECPIEQASVQQSE